MITLIGTSTTIIGFGLCGIDRVVEIQHDARIEQIQEIVDEATSPIIMIAERFVPDIRTDKIIIPIPDRYAPEPVDRLDALVQDVIGIKGD